MIDRVQRSKFQPILSFDPGPITLPIPTNSPISDDEESYESYPRYKL